MTNFLLFIDFELPGKTLGFVFLGLAAVIIAAIIVVKLLLVRSAESGELTDKYASQAQGSPLQNRNKYGAVDMLRKSGTVFNIGMIASLAFTVLAFSWTNYEKDVDIPDDAMELDEDFEQEPPRTAEPPPPPPPPPPPVIEEVPEEEIIEEEEPVFLDQDITADEEVEEVEEEEVDEPEPEVADIEEEPEEEEIFDVVEDMPRFPGCEGKGLAKAELDKCAEEEMLKFIYGNIKYPAVARENGIEGRAVVRFVVQKDGSIQNINVLRDPGGGTKEEVARIIKLMNTMPQKWTPGKQRGKPVKVQFTLPVSFKLQN